MKMKIAIIETGLPPEAIRSNFPTYPAMFEELINSVSDQFEFETFRICIEPFSPESFPAPEQYDGFLITGSAAGVYEDHKWIAPLLQFIREISIAKKPQIGICFGHQAIAQALGGKVVKSDKGWVAGRHTYNTTAHPNWLSPYFEEFYLSVSHQDQVVTQPPQSKLLASSEFCEFAALYYPDAPALSFQGHPEFSVEYSSALYNIRRGTILSAEFVDSAISSLHNSQDDNQLVAKWMCNFMIAHQQNDS